MIHFTRHAQDKFDILARHGVELSKDQVIQTVFYPDLVDKNTRFPLIIAQKELDKEHVLRVVYKQEDNIKSIITFYPGRKKQYEE